MQDSLCMLGLSAACYILYNIIGFFLDGVSKKSSFLYSVFEHIRYFFGVIGMPLYFFAMHQVSEEKERDKPYYENQIEDLKEQLESLKESHARQIKSVREYEQLEYRRLENSTSSLIRQATTTGYMNGYGVGFRDSMCAMNVSANFQQSMMGFIASSSSHRLHSSPTFTNYQPPRDCKTHYE